jgi:predicted GNAT family acetyltransferase
VKTEVVDRPEKHRYEVLADGEVAGFVQYQLGPGEILFIHTEIDEAYEGKGLGSVLVRHVLDDARRRKLAVLPLCPFVRGWIARHEDYLDLVPAAARQKYDLPAA